MVFFIHMRVLPFFILVWVVVFLMHWLVYVSISEAFLISVPYAYLFLSLLSVSYLVASFLVRKVGGVVSDLIYFGAATWLGTIFIIFSVQLPYAIVHLVTGYSSALISGGLFGLAIALSVYALWSGRSITTREYTLPLKHLKKPLRAVHLTDIHIGTVHQTQFLKQVVEMTNALAPEVVFITGDLFDGSVVIDESILGPLNTIAAPTFFSNGNHEEYEGLGKVRQTLSHLKIELLENRMVVHEVMQVVGVNDRQSLKRGETLGGILDSLALDPTLPTVLLYHTPVEWEAARARGVGLMLSGHTHNGQIYPFTLLVRLAFKYIKGLYEIDGKYLHVSPGTGTWGPPMRLGSRNQITVLNLVPGE